MERFPSLVFGNILCPNLKDNGMHCAYLKKNNPVFFFLLCVRNELPIGRRARSARLHVFHAYSQRSGFEKYTAVLLLLEVEENIKNAFFPPPPLVLLCKHRRLLPCRD